MTFTKGFLIFVSLITASPLISVASGKSFDNKSSLRTGFIENKGQIVNQHYSPNHDVLFLLNSAQMNVQLRRGGFSYDIQKIFSAEEVKEDDPKGSRMIENQRIDFDFIGYRPDCKIICNKPDPGYMNYYTPGAPDEGVTFVHSFSEITYQELYPFVDLVFSCDEKGSFKYTFIIHPGGDLESIKIRLSGAEFNVLPDSIVFTTLCGSLVEEIPFSYMATRNGESETRVFFTLRNKNTIGFSSPSMQPSACLYVDPVPVRLWATYYGGNGNVDLFGDIFFDNAGNILLGGHTNSSNNIASTGAHQQTYEGNQDLMFAKFDTAGERIWCTYYGGGDQEYGGNGAIDMAGHIYFCGFTFSDDHIATPGSHQPVRGGMQDAFLVCLDKDGIRQWSTYYGGTKSETGGCCSVDSHNNLYLVGGTTSPDQIATPGSWQELKNNQVDGYLVKFNPEGIRQWGTYFGSIGGDNPEVISISDSDIIYFGGQTTSSTGLTSPGAFQTNPGSVMDGFLVAFDTNGQRIWSTYYGGDGDDCITEIDASQQGIIYFSGFTRSTGNIATPGVYQSTSQGYIDGMVVKFSSDGNRLWGSYYGGAGTDIVWGCTATNHGEVVITGETNSGTGISTSNAFQTLFSGLNDGCAAMFDQTGQIIWGTYYGGSSFLSFQQNCVDSSGNMYACGETDCPSLVVTPDAWQPILNVPSDAIIVKFRYCQVPGKPGPVMGPSVICAPSDSLNYSISPDSLATGYIWVVPTGAVIISGQNTPSITIKINDTVFFSPLIVYARNDCGTGPPDTLIIIVFQASPSHLYGDTITCMGSGFTYYTDHGKSEYRWDFSDGGSVIAGGSSTSDSIVIFWNVQGDQWLKVSFTDTTGCRSDTSGLNISVSNSLDATVQISPSSNPVCRGDSVTLSAVPVNGGLYPVYQWIINGSAVQHNVQSYSYIPSDSDLVICRMISSLSCVLDTMVTDSLVIATFLDTKFVDTTLCFGTPYFAGNAWRTVAGIYFDTLHTPVDCIGYLQTNLQYKPQLFLDIGPDTTLCDGSIILDATVPGSSCIWQDGSTDYQYIVTNPGNFKVIVTSDGCSISDSISVNSCDKFLFFPNAFSPNGDGLNDSFRPVGRNVEEYAVRIYDRWGGLVYESFSVGTGWDGKYRDKPCPAGIYVYIATYNEQGNKNINVKGTIILER